MAFMRKDGERAPNGIPCGLMKLWIALVPDDGLFVQANDIFSHLGRSNFGGAQSICASGSFPWLIQIFRLFRHAQMIWRWSPPQ